MRPSIRSVSLKARIRIGVIEMSQAMLDAVINGETLLPMAEVVKRYCDVYDSPEEAEQIAASI
jgi:hypothetical protein